MYRFGNKYKLLIFDVDGTLYFQKPLRIVMALQMGLYYCLRPHKIKELPILRDFRIIREHWTHYSCEQFDKEIYAIVAKKHKTSEHAVEQLVQYWLYKAPLRYLARYTDSDLRDLIETVRKHGVTVVTFSDYPAGDKLIAMDINVDKEFSSSDTNINALKPDKKGLHIILEATGINAGQCLMAGDRDDKDGECARRAGIDYIILPPGKRKRKAAIYGLLQMLAE